MSKRILFGGLMAIGLMAASTDTASAQFVTPFGQPGPFNKSFQAAYPTPNGGVVQKYGYSSPYTGTYLNKSYTNPFTGVVNNFQAYQPYVSPLYPALYRPPVYFNNSFGNFGNFNGYNPFGFSNYNFGYSYGYRYFR